MSITIQTPEEVASSGLARWGLYADNGVGKTTLLASIPPEIRTLVVSADDENVKPLKGHSHIKVVKVSKWNDLADIFQLFSKAYQDPDIISGKKPFFRCLAFDTYTRIQRLAVNKVVGYELLKPGDEVQYIDRIPKLPQGWDGWQRVGALAEEWLRYFCRLPVHTIFVFQEQERFEKGEEGGSKIGPAMTPYALAGIKDALEIIGRMYVEVSAGSGGAPDPLVPAEKSVEGKKIHEDAKEVRKLLIGKHDRYITKGPTHKLGYVIDQPTWADLAKSLS